MIILCISVFIAMFTGCSKGSSKEGAAPTTSPELFDTTKPVKLTLYMGHLQPDDWIQKYITGPVQKKYPNISFEIVRKAKGSNPDELAAAGSFKIPGNESRNKVTRDAFFLDRTLAMYPYYADLISVSLADASVKGNRHLVEK